MDLRTTLKGIQGDNSIEASACRAMLKNEITLDEWAIMCALEESKRCPNVFPKPYVRLADPLKAYCMGRVDSRIPYDPEPAKRLGNWCMGVMQALQFNSERLEHYTWAADRTKPVSQEAHIELSKAADRFASHPFPQDDMRMCIATKKKDAEERDRQGRSA